MKPGRRGRHVLQIAEHPTGLEDVPAFPIKSPLALMGEVVNGEARANDVLSTQIRKRQRQIMLDDTNPVMPTESFTGTGDHGRRKVDGKTCRFRASQEQKTQQPAITRAEIENTPTLGRHLFNERGLTFCPVWNCVGPRQIGKRVIDVFPFVCHGTFIVAAEKSRAAFPLDVE